MQSSTDPRPVVVAVDARTPPATRRPGPPTSRRTGRRHCTSCTSSPATHRTSRSTRYPLGSPSSSTLPSAPGHAPAPRRRNQATSITTLTARGVGARMVVLGSYGAGAFAGMLAGTTRAMPSSRRGLPGCRGPRIGAPDRPASRGPVVVGVDGSAAGAAALAFGADLAASLGSACSPSSCWSDVYATAAASARRSHRSPRRWPQRPPQPSTSSCGRSASGIPTLAVERKLVDAPPLQALTEYAAGARALVVGTRGHQRADRHPDGLHQPGARRVRDLPGRRRPPAARRAPRSGRHDGDGGGVVNPIAPVATAVLSLLAALACSSW